MLLTNFSDPIAINSVDDLIDKYELDEVLHNSFIAILRYMIDYHSVKTLIIEKHYIDKDYSNEYSHLYSKTFSLRSGYCERWHFFSDVIKDINDFVLKIYDDKFIYKYYIGFMVKRPVRVGMVGRSIIKPNDVKGFFYLCSINKEIHMLGKTIRISGFPFIEQDSMVMTCAESSVWMVSKYMHYKHSLPRYLASDIIDKSVGVFGHIGRKIPSSGLTQEQLNVGLNNMGFFPIYTYKPRESEYDNTADYNHEKKLWKPLNFIYPYIESGIPVLICFDNHVCVVIGHKICQRNTDYIRHKNGSENKSILSSSIFIDGFIIHDDQQGIYRLLPSNQEDLLELEKSHTDLLSIRNKESKGYRTVEDDILAVIVPLPDKVYLLANYVFSNAERLFSSQLLYDLLNDAKDNKYARELIRAATLPEINNPIIFRPYLIKSTDYKEIINRSTINDQIKKYYLPMNMPRFVWVVEISTYSTYSENNLILGEILYDSTANNYDEESYLSIHLPGIFYQNDMIYEKSPIHDNNIPEEKPYKLVHRYNGQYCQ